MAAPLQLAPASQRDKISNTDQQTRSSREQPVEAPQLELSKEEGPDDEANAVCGRVDHRALREHARYERPPICAASMGQAKPPNCYSHRGLDKRKFDSLTDRALVVSA